MSTIERKYQLTKIAAGDYFLPSNDAQTIWRLRHEGPHDELPEDLGWTVYRWTGGLSSGHVDSRDWDRWEPVESTLPTRKAAIDAALRLA